MFIILLSIFVVGWVIYLILCENQLSRSGKGVDKFVNNNTKWDIPTHRLDWLDEDISFMYNVKVEKCVELCDADSTCKGFVYVPRESLCKFKSDFTKPVYSRGHITYLKS
jgi:hypothetical protein